MSSKVTLKYGRISVSKIIRFIILGVGISIYGQTPQQLPIEVSKQYTLYRDASISDEFNDKKLNKKKWSRRNSGGASVQDYASDKSLVKMEKEISEDGRLTSFVSIKGTAPKGVPRTAGLVNKASAFYGFYSVRFRFRGFDTDAVKEKGSVWHPSVWCGITNHNDVTSVKKMSAKDNKFWTEIDFMEWENGANGWSSDAPSRLLDSKGKKRKVVTHGKGAEKAIMTKGPFKTYAPVWQTLGLEYTPEYIKLWQWENGNWKHIGKRVVTFVEDDEVTPENNYTINTIGKKARKPVFWVLGNIVARYILAKVEDGTTKHTMSDLSVDFDFFRYYRHNSIVNIDWPWENGVKQGNKKIEKDNSVIEALTN